MIKLTEAPDQSTFPTRPILVNHNLITVVRPTSQSEPGESVVCINQGTSHTYQIFVTESLEEILDQVLNYQVGNLLFEPMEESEDDDDKWWKQ